MAEGVLGLGTGASSLNQELIDKLKAAERKSTVEPIETSLSDLDEEGVRIANIKSQVQDVLNAIKPFDLYVYGGANVFDQKSANATGDSVVFDAVDPATLNTGTTNVTVNQLAQRDVYQSGVFNDKDAILSDAVGSNLTINGVEYSTYNTTYTELAEKINSSSKFNASIEAVGTDSFRLVIKSEESGIDNALTITQSEINPEANQYVSTATMASGTVPAANLSLTLNGTTFTTNGTETNAEFISRINDDASFEASIDASGKVRIKSSDGGTLEVTTDDLGLDFNKTKGAIDLGINDYTSSSSIASGTVPAANLSLTLNGTTFTTNGTETNAEFISRINDDSSFNASIDSDGNVSIKSSDGGPIEITNDDLGLGLTNKNHTLSAQNMKAQIDGIDYDVSSNVVTVDGGLKISAVKLGDASISIEKDKTKIITMYKDFIDKFNTLSKSVDAELYSDDPKVQDRSSLRDIVSQIKNMMFNNYGTNDDLNLFNYGLEVDKSGAYSVNDTEFNKAVNDNYDDLKELFVGKAEKEGFGTQLKTIVDAMDSTDGVITSTEDNMASRKKRLDEDLEKATEQLDSKYSQLADQFSAYGTIINQFNAQFSSLQMIINQSTSK